MTVGELHRRVRYRIRWPDNTEPISQAGTVWASSRATVRKADRENGRRGNEGPDPTRSLEEKKSHWLIKKWLYCRPSFGAWILAVPLCLVAIVYKYVPVPTRQTIRHWSSSIMALKVSKNSQNSWYACFDGSYRYKSCSGGRLFRFL